MLNRRVGSMGTLVFLGALMVLGCRVNCQIEETEAVENKTGVIESRSRVFSPRMDYDEWTPLGRGDPLKNDPTFDYVPPVLDRVQYWLDSHTTEPSAKRDILVLGVTAKKTSPKIPEQFLKFVDGPKFNKNQEQFRNEHILHRNDFTGSTGAELPKIMRNTHFRSGLVDYRNHNRIQNIPASYYPSHFYNQKPKPYTMMLPPPVVPKPMDAAQTTYTSQKEKHSYSEQNQQFSTQTEEGPLQNERQRYNNAPKVSLFSQQHPIPRTSLSSPKPPPAKNQISQIENVNVFTPLTQSTKQKFQPVTTPSVSFEKSNLVYHSTQTISGGWLGNGAPSSSSSFTSSSSDPNQVTWQTPFNGQELSDVGDHHTAASSSHEVIIGQNANIIVDGVSGNDEEVVVGKQESASQENLIGPTPVSSNNIVQSSIFSIDESDSGDVVISRPSTSASSVKSETHIVVATTGSSTPDFMIDKNSNKESVAVIMPTNYMDKLNITNSDSMPEERNTTRDNNANTMTSANEQTIQISNPISTPNIVTNPPQLVTSQVNQMNKRNQVNHVNQMSKLNRVNSNNQIHNSRPIFTQLPQAQPLQSHRSQHFGQMMMTQMLINHGRQPPSEVSGAIPSQQMFNGQLGPFIQELPPIYPIPHPVESMTTPRVESVREHPYRMHQIQNTGREVPQMPFLPPPQAPKVRPVKEGITSSLGLVTDYIENGSPVLGILNNEMNIASTRLSTVNSTTTTTPRSTISTIVSRLTTDPIFSHYKQPAKPIRGPMYLIIQGHSKVKTYKPSVNRHGVPVENTEIREINTERSSKLEQLINENTRNRNFEGKNTHAEGKEKKEQPHQQRAEQDNLLTLVESNFSGFTVRPASSIEEERQSNSVSVIEINK